ncbi:efflux RND transporter permease subunit [Arthrobacter zhangbolii]|uniref:Efflux RND transporter permease subunit n=1 Tax=Arthrobacter zhangbolii TaxID=2886936 RepID=A0A9X1S9R0_9MICC|nr:efflux RND transporter permease subunit [Arthrobacter zhangbolii]MCC3273895.1 efflux RND transporter permease subunit [Arthrobacter zhangbolii]MCC3294666.1 efflux RND transporter permease subunit [Arthrobacter zhangbolii]UON91114.1 efflux RND transporter permease subunit [Arthrobacter zhangbolii]
MDRLAKLSLSNRALIALITVFVAVFGVISMSSLKQELIPSLEFPQISVITALPGASPEVVDAQVSEPLEGALTAVEGLESSSATSRSGISTIALTFAYGTDLDRARGQVDRAISNARQLLPEDTNPQSLAGSISDFPIVYLAVSSDEPLAELNADLQRLTVPRLQKIEGVRTAEVTGGSTRHVAILPDPAALAAQGATPSSIVDALENSGALLPAGTVDEESRTLSIQVGAPLDSLEKISALPIESSSDSATPVTIGDVASVEITEDEATSITRTNGQATLAVSITKTPAGDTVGISHEVTDLLPSLQDELGNGAKFTVIFDQAPFIEKSISDLTTEGLLGLGFAVLVILVFLLSVRSTLVTAVSIPLSLLVTFIGLLAFGYSLNILTLGALTIAIGRVVDDSIVVIENIKRHLGYGEDKRTAILTAVREVAGAVTASTLTTVAVFAPIAFVGGLAGELFRPFAVTTSLALLASLLVSLTIVPVLAYWFLKSSPPVADPEAYRAEAEEKETRSFLQRGYLPILRGTQRHPVYTVVAGLIILLATAAMTPLLPTNLLGDTGQNTFSVRQELPAGTSLERTSEAAEQVEEALSGVDGVKDVQVTMGTSTSGIAAFTAGGSSVANFTVITEEGEDQVALRDAVRAAIEDLDDAGDVTLGSTGGGFGTSNTVDINLSAGDPAELQPASDALVEAMSDLPGVAQASSNLSSSQPVVQVTIDRAKAVAAGLNEQQIAGLVASTISPLPAGSVRLGTDDLPVLIGEGTPITSLEQLNAVSVPAGAGSVPLSELATVEEVSVPTSVSSSGGERTAIVSVSPDGDNLGATITEVQARLADVDLPASVTAELSGAATQQNESFTQLGLALLAAIAIVYVIMVATFKSLLQPLILLVSIPFAATGAILLLLISGIPLGLPSLVGMLMLVGIVVTNAIVLMDLINQYRRPRGSEPGMNVEDAIFRGARQRLRPILMTALATIFALTPMALGVTGEGGFISRPLAVVVIGGLISSTALTLILVPVLYRLLEGSREKRAQRKEQVPAAADA